jgi:hypothetical protein
VSAGEDDEGKYAVTSIRRLGALALAVPLAAGAVVFAPGAAAQAAGTGIMSPGGNAVITSGSSTTVAAHLDLLATGDLYVRGPGTGGDRKIGGGVGPKDISGRVNTSQNGAYVVTLKGLLGTIDQRTFYVRVPPARPSGVDASVSEQKLVVRWNRGHESGLTGYDVFVGGALQRQGSPGALCAGDVCSTALSLPASSGRVGVGVRARRSNGTGGTIASGLSTASVALPASAALAGGRAPAAGLPSASANPLLPLPGSSPLSLPTVAPDGQVPGFQYPTPGPQVADPQTNLSAQKSSSGGVMRWGKSVALALILLIVAAHLGAWTRRLRLAQASAADPATAGAARARKGRKGSSPGETERRRGTGAPAKVADDPPVNGDEALRTPQVRSTDGRGPAQPASGRLIDAKAPVADAALLSVNGGPRRSAEEPAGDEAGDPSPAGVVATATAGARTATQDGTAPARSKTGRSHGRRSAAYRGRRRAD